MERRRRAKEKREKRLKELGGANSHNHDQNDLLLPLKLAGRGEMWGFDFVV